MTSLVWLSGNVLNPYTYYPDIRQLENLNIALDWFGFILSIFNSKMLYFCLLLVTVKLQAGARLS